MSGLDWIALAALAWGALLCLSSWRLLGALLVAGALAVLVDWAVVLGLALVGAGAALGLVGVRRLLGAFDVPDPVWLLGDLAAGGLDGVLRQRRDRALAGLVLLGGGGLLWLLAALIVV